ncbi:MAG: type II secretion system protein N [Steroidobacteraceae bacterium]
MSRRRLLLAIFSASAVVGAIAWLPARVASPLLPHGIDCAALTGTVWRGRCAGSSIRSSRSGSVSWALGVSIDRPAGIALRWQWIKDQSDARGVWAGIGRGTSALRIDHLSIDLQTLRDAFPTDVLIGPLAALSGRVEGSELTLAFESGRVSALHGGLTVSRASWLQTGAGIGPFTAQFDGRTGVLRDVGGPLDVRATLALAEPGRFTAKVRLETRTPNVVPSLVPGFPLEAEIEGQF